MPPFALTLAHGFAALAGLAFLIGSGKLSTLKDDWAANHVFLFGATGILVLCIIAGISQRRLAAQAAHENG
jgi:hypothetical protein